MYKPKRKQDEFGQILPVAGQVVGGMFGGPPGAAAGGALGGMVGQDVGGGGQETAMSRRMSATEEDPLIRLKKAQTALAQLPDEQQQQFAPTINRALMMAERRNGGMNNGNVASYT